MEIKTNRLPIIDTLRDIAALSICYLHLVQGPEMFDNYSSFYHSAWLFHNGVSVFFIISGVVIPLSLINMDYRLSKFKAFIIKRFIRIEPPYIATIILGLVYFNIRKYVGGTTNVDLNPSLRDLLLHIGYLVPFVHGAKWISFVFWSLSIEFQYYLFLAFLFPLVLNFNRWRFLFYTIVFTLPFTSNNIFIFPVWASYFSLGIFYALFIKGKMSKFEFWVLITIASIIISLQLGMVQLCIGGVTLAVIHLFSNFESILGKFFGKISYSLYLTHSFVGIATINILERHAPFLYEKIIVFIIALLVTISFAYCFFRLIEKPSQEFSKKIKT